MTLCRHILSAFIFMLPDFVSHSKKKIVSYNRYERKQYKGNYRFDWKKNYFDCIVLYRIGRHQNHGVVFFNAVLHQ